MSKLAAVILAAGLSSRMGAFKPLLPLNNGTVLSECIDVFLANDIDHIIVVTGNRAGEVGAVSLQAGIQTVHNPGFLKGMFSSVQTGVGMLDKGVSGFFMLPVDLPLVRYETVGMLMDEFLKYPAPVVYPRFLRERGHPPLISGKLIPEILAHDGEGGLRAVLQRHESAARDLDVADFGTIHDLDHPADYGLARTLAGNQFPTEDECRQLFIIYDVPLPVQAHSKAVAKVAEAICNRLNTSRPLEHCLDLELTVGAALTHDLGKGHKHHERVGADRLKHHGFQRAASIAATHTEREISQDYPVSEGDIVFLADKLVRETQFIPLEGRYTDKLKQYGDNPDVRSKILNRLRQAKAVLERLEQEAGISIEQLARKVLS